MTQISNPTQQESISVNRYSFQQAKTLVIIDASVSNLEILKAGLKPETEVVVLHPQLNGIEQITSLVSKRQNLQKVHLVSHGSIGSIKLGTSELNSDNLNDYSAQIQTWFADSGDRVSLYIYGCQVAANQEGQNFVQELHNLTGANIAAATRKVGSSDDGGVWLLDYKVGNIKSEIVFTDEVIEAYSGTFMEEDEVASELDPAITELQLEELLRESFLTDIEPEVEEIEEPVVLDDRNVEDVEIDAEEAVVTTFEEEEDLEPEFEEIEEPVEEFEPEVEEIEEPVEEFEPEVEEIEEPVEEEFEPEVEAIDEVVEEEFEPEVEAIDEVVEEEFEPEVEAIDEVVEEEFEPEVEAIDEADEEFEPEVEAIDEVDEEFEPEAEAIDEVDEEFEPEVEAIDEADEEFEPEVEAIDEADEEFEPEVEAIDEVDEEFEPEAEAIDEVDEEFEPEVEAIDEVVEEDIVEAEAIDEVVEEPIEEFEPEAEAIDEVVEEFEPEVEAIDEVVEEDIVEAEALEPIEEPIEEFEPEVEAIDEPVEEDIVEAEALEPIEEPIEDFEARLSEITANDLIDLSGVAEGDTILTEFSVSRDASFNNTADFYEVNADGSVVDPESGETIAPGEAGYTEAALANRVGLELAAEDGQVAEFSAELEGGNFYAPMIAVETGFEAFSDDDPSNDPTIYFTYADANDDDLDHVSNFAPNVFGFEDLTNIGDGDYNDLIVTTSFSDTPEIADESVIEPVVETVVIEEPVAEAPEVIEEPVVEEPAVEEPVVEEPVAEAPEVIEEPAVEEPVVEEPVAEAPEVIEEPVVEEPAVEEPAVEEPVAEAPEVIEEPEVEEPVVEEAEIEEPVVEEPVVEEPVVEEPVVEEPVAEAPEVIEEPVVEEAVVEEPAVEEPEVEEPVVEEAVVEEAVVEEPVAEAPEVIEESSAASDINGVEIQLGQFAPNLQTLTIEPLSAIIGDDVEFSFGGVESDISGSESTSSQIDIVSGAPGEASIIYDIGSSQPPATFGDDEFNGLVFFDSTGELPPIENVTLNQSATTIGIDPSAVAFTEDTVEINFANVSIEPGLTARFDIDFADV